MKNEITMDRIEEIYTICEDAGVTDPKFYEFMQDVERYARLVNKLKELSKKNN
jgi:hypothetical protein